MILFEVYSKCLALSPFECNTPGSVNMNRAFSGPKTRPAAVAEQTGWLNWIFFVMLNKSNVAVYHSTDESRIHDHLNPESVIRLRQNMQTADKWVLATSSLYILAITNVLLE